MTSEEIEDAAIAATIALDPKSPFHGMVDLTELFEHSIEDQWKIFNALPARIKAIVSGDYEVKSTDLNQREFAKMMKQRRQS